MPDDLDEAVLAIAHESARAIRVYVAKGEAAARPMLMKVAEKLEPQFTIDYLNRIDADSTRQPRGSADDRAALWLEIARIYDLRRSEALKKAGTVTA